MIKAVIKQIVNNSKNKNIFVLTNLFIIEAITLNKFGAPC
jgi:hypothetical protein